MGSIRMRIAFLAIILLFLAGGRLCAQLAVEECSDTEAWIPFGTAPGGRCVVAAEMDGKLYGVYSVHNSHPTNDSTFRLARLDGSTWTVVSSFKVSERNTINDLVAYRGALYLAGNFNAVNALPHTSGLARWDGTAWGEAPGVNPLNGISVGTYCNFRAIVYNGQLVISGAFGASFSLARWGIAAYDGTTLTMFGESSVAGDSVVVNSFAVWRGDLVAAVVSSTGSGGAEIGGAPMNGLARWNGTAWEALTGNLRYRAWLAVYNNDLYVLHGEAPGVSRCLVQRWDGSNWENLTAKFSRDVIASWNSDFNGNPVTAVHNGSLYILAVPLKMVQPNTPGPKYPLGVRVALRWDGTAFHEIANLNSTARMLIEHDGALVVGGDFTSSCALTTRFVARLCDATECGGVSGRVVISDENDCGNLVARPGSRECVIEVSPGPRYVMTDSVGNYRFMTEPGSYVLHLTPPRYNRQTCPADGADRTAIVVTPGQRLTGMNFAHTPLARNPDIDVSLTGSRPRVGGIMQYNIVCINRGTEGLVGGTLTLSFDRALGFDHADPAATREAGSELEWTVEPMAPGWRREFRVYVRVPTTVEFGTSICARADIEIAGDVHPEWNHDSLCLAVLNSYDPNDIAVVPAGQGEQGLITPKDSVLTYTVRFQNDGNDTAYKVIVIDTLSPYVDPASIMLGASSHPSRLTFGMDGSLIWIFDRIMLPASAQDGDRSQGNFKFSVRLKQGLMPHTEITNRASIYFDYNQPVVTNTVRSTLVPALGVGRTDAVDAALSIYPNPTTGALRLRGDIVPGSTVRVENLLGQTVMVLSATGDREMPVDLTGLPAGAYLLRAETSHGSATLRVMVAR